MNQNDKVAGYHKGKYMEVSSINANNSRRNMFIKYANSFMSNPTQTPEDVAEKTQATVPNNNKSMGIETLTTFSIFPKQVVNGKTIITA